jgi:hypothetical protein
VTTPVAAFYAAELTIHRGFSDPIGPADLPGFGSTPMLALCQIEAGAAANTTLTVSDAGYRTKSTDPLGVLAYPPRITEAFSVSIQANLDPTQSSVAASWGTLTLTNMDHAYDTYINNWQSDGQAVTILRGEKTYDSARGIWLDPAYASLVPVFKGVLGPWATEANLLKLTLRDASYYLEKLIPRLTYAGTGGREGTIDLTGVSKPLLAAGVLQGNTTSSDTQNVSPLLIDPANLIYQFSTAFDAEVDRVYDGGLALSIDSPPTVVDLYAAAPATGKFQFDTKGLFRLGSTPTFGVTADVVNISGPYLYNVLEIAAYQNLLTLLGVPTDLIASATGSLSVPVIQSRGVDPTQTAQAMALLTSMYLAATDSLDGITFMSKLLGASGALLVAGRDGRLCLFVLAAIPPATASVLTLDDSVIVTITPVALPASIDPPPWRMRLAFGRNWTVQTSPLAGAITAAQQAFISVPVRVVTAIGPASSGVSRPTDPPVIGSDSGSADFTAASPQLVVNGMIALWGTKRYLYDIVVPASVGLTLDWGSVVSVVSDFDSLQTPGKQGQIVGWHYASGDSTATFRVLV